MNQKHLMIKIFKKDMIKKKNYVDFFNKYIIILFLIFKVKSYIFIIFYKKSEKIVLKRKFRLIIRIIFF